MKTLIKAEASLLLYFETCAVDYGGKVDAQHLNTDDLSLAKQWSREGFVDFGRICRASIEASKSKRSHWVELSETAWQMAHAERRARASRMAEARCWQKTAELKNGEQEPA